MNHLEFSGIAKVPSSSVHIHPTALIKACQLTDKNNLTRLPVNKLHVTLIHQSVLKALLKAEKKAQKNGDSTIKYPVNQLRPIVVDEATDVVVVEDTHPRTGEFRKTVRIILNDNEKTYLSSWVEEFCELNNLERDEQELSRVYHVSYSNRTGMPGDSVR